MKNKNVIVGALGVVFAIILGLSAYFYQQWSSQKDVHKLVMPATYKIDLKPDTYSIWNYSSWPSKGINEVLKPIKITITGDKEIQLIPSESTNGGPDVKRSGRIGRTDFHFDIKAAGTYLVTCDSRCVVIIVPTRLEYPATSMDDHWIDFPGAEDDFNFEAAYAPR